MLKNGVRPVHAGEVLREDYLVPLGLTANALAKALKQLMEYELRFGVKRVDLSSAN